MVVRLKAQIDQFSHINVKQKEREIYGG